MIGTAIMVLKSKNNLPIDRSREREREYIQAETSHHQVHRIKFLAAGNGCFVTRIVQGSCIPR